MASEIIRQSGVLDEGPRRKWPRRSLVRFFIAYFGINFIVPAGVILAYPMQGFGFLGGLAVQVMTIPVNPQGRADYFLKNPS